MHRPEVFHRYAGRDDEALAVVVGPLDTAIEHLVGERAHHRVIAIGDDIGDLDAVLQEQHRVIAQIVAGGNISNQRIAVHLS